MNGHPSLYSDAYKIMCCDQAAGAGASASAGAASASAGAASVSAGAASSAGASSAGFSSSAGAAKIRVCVYVCVQVCMHTCTHMYVRNTHASMPVTSCIKNHPSHAFVSVCKQVCNCLG
jgi:hypothetical protein